MTVQPGTKDFSSAEARQRLDTVTWHFPSSGNGRMAVRLDKDGTLTLSGRAGEIAAAARLTHNNPDLAELSAVQLEPSRPDAAHLLAALIDAVFLRLPGVTRVHLPSAEHLAATAALATETIIDPVSGEKRAVVYRIVFQQLPLLWRRQQAHVAYPLLRSSIGPEDRLPPLRPPRPSGIMYERWLPELDLVVSLRPIDRRSDLGLFHRWMNQGRVAFYWELAKSAQELDAYLAEQEADPHIFGVIASFDGEPAGYFEFYWAKEDRLGPYYEPEDFDRGWHGLVGNPRHLGWPKTHALFRSVTHYLFLDEPRTRRIMGEPRASHKKMLSYAAQTAYEKIKEFDFPHKRAALVCCERERFFREVPL